MIQHFPGKIQVSPFSWMRNRIIFYIAKLLWSQFRSGGSYEEIHQVISTVIRDYPLLPEERGYLNEYELHYRMPFGCRYC